MNKKKIIITGAFGFTGIHACNYFSNNEYQVISVSRSNKFADEICDLSSQVEITKLIARTKPDAILHLAGMNHAGKSWDDPISTFQNNVMTTLYLLEAVRKEAPKCKVLIISSALNPNAGNPYIFSKKLQAVSAAEWATMFGLQVVIAKPGNLIGPGPSNGVCSLIAKQITEKEREGTTFIIDNINIKAERDFLDVRDAVAAYELLLRKGIGGKTYNVSSGQLTALDEVMVYYKKLAAVDFEISEGLFAEDRQQAINSKELEELGWKRRYNLPVSLKHILEYYRGGEKRK